MAAVTSVERLEPGLVQRLGPEFVDEAPNSPDPPLRVRGFGDHVHDERSALAVAQEFGAGIVDLGPADVGASLLLDPVREEAERLRVRPAGKGEGDGDPGGHHVPLDTQPLRRWTARGRGDEERELAVTERTAQQSPRGVALGRAGDRGGRAGREEAGPGPPLNIGGRTVLERAGHATRITRPPAGAGVQRRGQATTDLAREVAVGGRETTGEARTRTLDGGLAHR